MAITLTFPDADFKNLEVHVEVSPRAATLNVAEDLLRTFIYSEAGDLMAGAGSPVRAALLRLAVGEGLA